jgi:hypothetical protein
MVRCARKIPTILGLLAAAAAGVGCVDSPEVLIGSDDPQIGERVVVADVPPRFNRNLDLLFVVDDSENMAARQLALASSFRELSRHLETTEGGLPDMHVGVVSTDLGAGGYEYSGCADPQGRRGVLQSAPTRPACRAPEGSFLMSYDGGDSGRLENFDGDLGSAFQCIAQLGTNGCMYRQPLEAMRLALDGTNPENDGFLRHDAVLAVVLLTEADDCSASTAAFFDPNLPAAVGSPLFRCFQFGVTCDGDDAYMPGERDGCSAHVQSPYLHGVGEYASFLQDLKASRDQVVVSGIMGDPSLVEVSVDFEGTQQLVPACADEAGGADPAIRLNDFVGELQRGAEFRSICNGVSSAVLQTAQQIRRGLGTNCLEGYVSDSDPDIAGRQPDCLVWDDDGNDHRTAIVACDRPYATEHSSDFPCYAFKRGLANCSSYPTQLGIEVNRGLGAPPHAGHVVVECYVDDAPAM